MADPVNEPIPQPASERPLRSKVFKAARIIVSLALLVLVLREMGIENTAKALRSADLFWIVMVLVLMLAEGVHGTYKWLILLRHTNKSIKFWPLFKIIYVSGFVGMFVPGGIGIELVRMYGLAKHTSDLAMSFTSILMDRILGLTGLATVILIGVVMQGRSSIPGIEWWTIGALLLILGGWVAIMNPWFRKLTDSVLRVIIMWMRRSPRLLAGIESGEVKNDRFVRRAKFALRRVQRAIHKLMQTLLIMIRDKQAKVYQSLDTYRNRPGLLAWGMVQSLLYNGIRIAVCCAAGLAVGVEAPVSAYVIAVPLVIFVMLIPVSMAGWGVREVMFVQLLTPYGADGDKVLAMSLLLGVLGTVSIFPGAWFCIQGMGKARAERESHAG